MGLRAYLELCRASNLPTVWTNALAAAVLSEARTPGPALLAGASVTLTYLGGMALNDVLDADEDRVKKPERPIPSGRVTRAGAATFAALLFGGGLVLLAFCGLKPLLAGGGLLLTVGAYDSLHQKSALTVVLMATCRAFIFVVTGLAVDGDVNRWVALAGAAQFLYIIALTAVARWEKAAPRSFKVPPIPWLLAGISLVDGVVLAVFSGPLWLAAGIAGAASTRLLQTQVRGD